MSDFDKVLERLVGDPTFQVALAADPASALAGYNLDAGERELLATRLETGPGGDRLVETRTNKSGVAGLLGPVVASFGVAAGSQTIGSAPGGGAFGVAAGSQTIGSAPGGAFGSAPTAREAVGPAARGTETVGEAGPVESVGTAAGPGTSSLGSAPTEPVDYSTRVDVNGDGLWDDHRAYERADGGVDIHADVDNDGVVNFIGHDYDRDGLIDMVEFDHNLDGVMDTRMYDDTGDGWMDRGEAIGDEGPTEGFGSTRNPS
jgi:hypothetical protein